MSNISNEIKVITEQYNAAIALLGVRKEELIAKVSVLVNRGKYNTDFLNKILTFTKNKE